MEDLAGMMAFLTRNGLSAAMAATSAGRALDAIAHPSTVKKLTQLGATMIEALGPERAAELGFTAQSMFAVTDSAGKFRPIAAIMADLGKRVRGLNTQELAAFMQTLLRGSGSTIQARRFFDVAIRNFDELNQRTGEMRNSAGAMQEAYRIMFDQPQSQVQLLTNQYQVMKTEIGDALVPVKLQLVNAGLKVLAMWNKLDPATQNTIVKYAALAAAAATVVGGLVAAVGTVMLFVGAAAALGIGIGALAGIFAVLVAAAAAAGGIAYYLYKNWDTWGPRLKAFWQQVQQAVQVASRAIADTAARAADIAVRAWVGMRAGWRALVAYFRPAVTELGAYFGQLGRDIKAVWDRVIGPFLTQAKDAWLDFSVYAGQVFERLPARLRPALASLSEAWQNLRAALEPLRPVLVQIGKILGTLAAGGVITALVTGLGLLLVIARTLAGVLGPLIERMVDMATVATNTAAALLADLTRISKGFWTLLQGLLTLNPARVLATLASLPGKVAEVFTTLAGRSLSVLGGFADRAAEQTKGMAATVTGTLGLLRDGAVDRIGQLTGRTGQQMSVWSTGMGNRAIETAAKIAVGLGQLVTSGGAKLREFVDYGRAKLGELPGKAWTAVAPLVGAMTTRGSQAINGLGTGMRQREHGVRGWLSGLGDRMRGTLGQTSLFQAGWNIVASLWRGLRSRWDAVRDWIRSLTSWIAQHKGPRRVDLRLLQPAGRAIVTGLINGMNSQLPALTASLGDLSDLSDLITSTDYQAGLGFAPAMASGAGLGTDAGEVRQPAAQGRSRPATRAGEPDRGQPAVPVNVTVHTQEINPVKHAADLGWEIARRLGH